MTTFPKTIPNCKNNPKPSRSRAVTLLPIWFSALLLTYLLITYLLTYLPTWWISDRDVSHWKPAFGRDYCDKNLTTKITQFTGNVIILDSLGHSEPRDPEMSDRPAPVMKPRNWIASLEALGPYHGISELNWLITRSLALVARSWLSL